MTTTSPWDGFNLTTGFYNIDIGNGGITAESNTILLAFPSAPAIKPARIEPIAGIYNVNEGGTIEPVYINSNGQLGTQPPASPCLLKKEIRPTGQTSGAILDQKPVTFQRKMIPPARRNLA